MTLVLSPAVRDLLESWLGQLGSLANRADTTIDAYGRDLTDFLNFQAQHAGDILSPAMLRDLSLGEMRAWMAAQRGRGVGSRSLAR